MVKLEQMTLIHPVKTDRSGSFVAILVFFLSLVSRQIILIAT